MNKNPFLESFIIEYTTLIFVEKMGPYIDM